MAVSRDYLLEVIFLILTIDEHFTWKFIFLKLIDPASMLGVLLIVNHLCVKLEVETFCQIKNDSGPENHNDPKLFSSRVQNISTQVSYF